MGGVTRRRCGHRPDSRHRTMRFWPIDARATVVALYPRSESRSPALSTTSPLGTRISPVASNGGNQRAVGKVGGSQRLARQARPLSDREFEGSTRSARRTDALSRSQQFPSIGRNEVGDRQGAGHAPVVVDNGDPGRVGGGDGFERSVESAVRRYRWCARIGHISNADIKTAVTGECGQSNGALEPSERVDHWCAADTGRPDEFDGLAHCRRGRQNDPRARRSVCRRDRRQQGSPAVSRRASVSARVRIWLR